MLIRDAQLYIFDDASAALDVETEKILWENIHEYTQKTGATCLIVTNKDYAARKEELDHAWIFQ